MPTKTGQGGPGTNGSRLPLRGGVRREAYLDLLCGYLHSTEALNEQVSETRSFHKLGKPWTPLLEMLAGPTL